MNLSCVLDLLVLLQGQDGPIWFNIWKGDVYYVEEVDLHFKLYNPNE
jgi:ligand-binding sensor domain-containing protein